MKPIRGLKPLFGEGMYEVKTTQGEGYLYYSEEDEEWFNVEIEGEIHILGGDVIGIGRQIKTVGTEEVQIH